MITVKQFQFNFVGENTYLLFDETKEAVLIDCGCMTPEEENTLKSFISLNNLSLKKYLCTHLHFDHIIGNSFVLNTYGLNPEANYLDVEHLPKVSTQMASMGIQLPEIADIPIKHYIKDGDIIQFGNSELKALLVPGHSPGSLAFYCEADGFVIVGDALFKGSIGRTDLWMGNYETLIHSINKQLLTLPDSTTVYSGHGESTTIKQEKQNNPFL